MMDLLSTLDYPNLTSLHPVALDLEGTLFVDNSNESFYVFSTHANKSGNDT